MGTSSAAQARHGDRQMRPHVGPVGQDEGERADARDHRHDRRRRRCQPAPLHDEQRAQPWPEQTPRPNVQRTSPSRRTRWGRLARRPDACPATRTPCRSPRPAPRPTPAIHRRPPGRARRTICATATLPRHAHAAPATTTATAPFLLRPRERDGEDGQQGAPRPRRAVVAAPDDPDERRQQACQRPVGVPTREAALANQQPRRRGDDQHGRRRPRRRSGSLQDRGGHEQEDGRAPRRGQHLDRAFVLHRLPQPHPRHREWDVQRIVRRGPGAGRVGQGRPTASRRRSPRGCGPCGTRRPCRPTRGACGSPPSRSSRWPPRARRRRPPACASRRQARAASPAPPGRRRRRRASRDDRHRQRRRRSRAPQRQQHRADRARADQAREREPRQRRQRRASGPAGRDEARSGDPRHRDGQQRGAHLGTGVRPLDGSTAPTASCRDARAPHGQRARHARPQVDTPGEARRSVRRPELFEIRRRCAGDIADWPRPEPHRQHEVGAGQLVGVPWATTTPGARGKRAGDVVEALRGIREGQRAHQGVTAGRPTRVAAGGQHGHQVRERPRLTGDDDQDEEQEAARHRWRRAGLRARGGW